MHSSLIVSIRRYRFVLSLLITILLFIILIIVGTSYSWPLVKPEEEGIWLLLGILIAIIAFINERLDNIASRRIEIQLAFFDRWQELKSKIESLEKKADPKEAAIIFRRYFELLSLEYLMNIHINPIVVKNWIKYRKAEFNDPTIYASKKFSEWWDYMGANIENEKFRNGMEELRLL